MSSSTFNTIMVFALFAAVFITEIQGQTPAAPRKRREQSCEVLVTSESGAGEINSLDKTSAMEGKIECDWVIIGKPGSSLNLKFLAENAINTRSSKGQGPTSMACNDCETECCNSVELIEGGVSTRYCCADLPSEVKTNSNAVIVRLHRDSLSEKSKGFVLNWSE